MLNYRNEKKIPRGKKLLFPSVVIAEGAGKSPIHDYSRALEKARALVRSRTNDLARERSVAPRFVDELLARPAEGRRLWVQNSPRFHSWVLSDMLLRRCEDEWMGSPLEAAQLADLASFIADNLDCQQYCLGMIQDLRALAVAYQGNSQRILGNPEEAERCLLAASRRAALGTGDSLLEARISCLRAVFLGAQERFEEALVLIDRVVSVYLRAADRHRVGRTLISKAKLLIDSGAPERAAWFLRRALRWIETETEPRLVLVIRHNLICSYVAQGEFSTARKMMANSRSLYSCFPEKALQESQRNLEVLMEEGLAASPGDAAASPQMGRRAYPALAAEEDGETSCSVSKHCQSTADQVG